jgi:hypothetical protein
LELLDPVVKKTITLGELVLEFTQTSRVNGEVLDFIGEILEYFESLNNDYNLLRNQVLDSLEEFYLKMQKFIEE